MLKHDFLQAFEPPDRKDGFNVLLFRVFMKADKDNMVQLETAFPEHFKIYTGWKRFGVDYSDSQLVVT